MWTIKRTILSERIDIYEELAEALNDGEAILQFLEKKQRRFLARGKPLAQVYGLWAQKMQDSGYFSKAVMGTVPESDAMIIKSAEISGSLSVGLEFLASVVQGVNKMRKTVVSGLAMPAVVFTLLTVLIVLFSLKGVPIFAEVVPPEKWHPAGQAMYAMSTFVTSYGFFILLFFIGAVWCFFWSLPNWVGPLRDRFDDWVPYSMYRDYHGAVFLVVLASLLKSNIAIAEALQTIQETATPWMRRHAARMLVRLRRGVEPAEALHTGILHEDIAYRVIDYGERAGFNAAIEKIGFRSIDLVTDRIGAGTKVIFVASIIIAGSILAFIVLSFMLTAMNFGDAATVKGRF